MNRSSQVIILNLCRHLLWRDSSRTQLTDHKRWSNFRPLLWKSAQNPIWIRTTSEFNENQHFVPLWCIGFENGSYFETQPFKSLAQPRVHPKQPQTIGHIWIGTSFHTWNSATILTLAKQTTSCRWKLHIIKSQLFQATKWIRNCELAYIAWFFLHTKW